MASRRGRGLVPQRPLVRIVLLLAVAGMASGIAGAVFTGGETTARDPIVAEAAATPASPTAEATTGETSGPESTPAEAPAPKSTTGESPAPEQVAAEPPAPIEPAAPERDVAEPPAPIEPAVPEQTAPEPSPPAATPAAPPASGQTATQPPPPEAAAQLIEQMRTLVAAPDPNTPDYDRDYFAGWVDTDGDCVNTRHEILQEEALEFSMNAEGCAVASGEWFDPYTNRTFTNPRDLDVDHVVALADAWVSGAWRWADEVLDRFSNDLGNLNAIAAGENRSKSARGPATYSPSASGARCDYLAQYATVKIRWELSITPDDFDVLAAGLRGCEIGAVPDAPPVATETPSSAPPPPTTTTAPRPTATAAAPASDCHPAYDPCLPNLPGDALNCGDLRSDQKPVTVIVPGTDPYRLDRDRDGRGCTS